MTYSYEIPQGGYHWVMRKRCLHEVGIEPINMYSDGEKQHLQFSRELTPKEKNKLDVLMLDDPTYPPKNSGTVLTIGDLQEVFDKFCLESGVDLKIYYTESEKGSGKLDQIELHSKPELTRGQINKIKTVYANLIQG